MAGLSRMRFAARVPCRGTACDPMNICWKRRIERAEELLKAGRHLPRGGSFDRRLQTQAHFTTVFKRFAGDTPLSMA